MWKRKNDPGMLARLIYVFAGFGALALFAGCGLEATQVPLHFFR